MTYPTIASLLSRLTALDVKLWVHAGKLKLNAPLGAISLELKAELAQAKPALIEALSIPASAPARVQVLAWPTAERLKWLERAWTIERFGQASRGDAEEIAYREITNGRVVVQDDSSQSLYREC